MLVTIMGLLPFAPAFQAEAATVRVPSGWRQEKRDGATVLTPADLPSGQVFRVVVDPPQELKGFSLREWFAEQLKADADSPGKLRKEGPIEEKSHGALVCARVFEDGEGDSLVSLEYGLERADGRAQRVRVVSTQGRTPPEKYLRDAAGVIAALKTGFPAQGEKSPVRPYPSGASRPVQKPKDDDPGAKPASRSSVPIENVTLIREYSLTQQGGDFTPQISWQPYILLKDGSYYNGIPSAAPDDWDIAASRANEPKRWGKWRRQGGRLILLPSSGKPKEHAADQYMSVTPGNGKLNGSYFASSVSGSQVLDRSSQLATWGTLTFSPDGSFRQETGAGFSDSGDSGGVTARGGAKTAGTYSISGYAITLRARDGTVVRRFFYQPTDKTIAIGGRTYLKK